MNTASPSFGKSLFELLSSMRFAISLLSILAVASIVGTVLKQAEPYNNYVIQFGPYWFQVFEKLGLYPCRSSESRSAPARFRHLTSDVG